MKKSILSVIAVALVGVFAFTSCNKDQTKKDFLTQSKGWKMVEATCATGITTTTNNKIYDLMDTENGYFFECEKDDILTFKEDGYVYFNPGKNVNDEGMELYPSQETAMGTWTLDEENDILTTHFPWEYDFVTPANNGPGEDKTMYNTVFKKLDIGDIIGVKGFVFTTQTGAISIHVKEYTLLCKSIRPLPIVKEKDGTTYDAFSDPEQRYRQRYLDLIVNPQVKETFIKRTKLIIKGM